MIMPSYTTLPESMLGNSALLQKFAVPALAGLRGMGCGCSSYDCTDSEGNPGVCCDPDPCTTDDGSSGSGSGSATVSPVFNPSDCAYGGTYPDCNAAPITPTAAGGCPAGQVSDPALGGDCASQTVQQYCTAEGWNYNASQGICVSPSGSVSSTPGLTTSQISAIIAGATKVGTVAAAGATGATVLPNGMVIGSGGSTTAMLSSLTSMLPIILIGMVAIFAFKGGGK